tara:strand:+ start:116 stop:253 length:138 start_codon:yes stop_codon:yes gene_type:complete
VKYLARRKDEIKNATTERYDKAINNFDLFKSYIIRYFSNTFPENV